MTKPRLVIDTNIFISAIIVSGSLPDQLIRLWQADSYTLIVSTQLITEIEAVLQRDEIKSRYNLSVETITQILTLLRLSSEMMSPFSEDDLPIHSRDGGDDKLLALAIGGKADYLVTGDKDLLVLNGNPLLDNLKIVVVKEFLEIGKMNNGLRDLQGSLSTTSIGKRFSLEEVIGKAEKKEAKRLVDEN